MASVDRLCLLEDRHRAIHTKYTILTRFQVSPSANLQWTPCYENFTCASLEVPLDYTDPSIGTTNIAFLKVSALQQPAKGDIIINPGGPGESGVGYVVEFQLYLQRTLGPNFNIIGMDPRGIDNSGPNLDCFKGNPAARDYYDHNYYTYDSSSNFSMAEHFEASGGFGDWCSESLTQEANYANTPATARDMLQYIEKLAESCGEDPKEAKLNYYGVSYGSALGTTYAALFPDRVGHMIIDGVVDGTDYYGGSWTQNLLLADEAVESFFQYCFDAGPLCVFYQNDTSSQAIGARLNAILNDLDTSPIRVTDKTVVDFPAVITSIDLRSYLLLSVYGSVNSFPTLAGVLAGLEVRNASTMVGILNNIGTPKGVMPKASCDWEGPAYSPVQPKLLVACNDMDGRYNISTVETWHEYVEELESISAYVGEVWAAVITLQCRSLKFSPPETQKFYGKSSLCFLLLVEQTVYLCTTVSVSCDDFAQWLQLLILIFSQASTRQRRAILSCLPKTESIP